MKSEFVLHLQSECSGSEVGPSEYTSVQFECILSEIYEWAACILCAIVSAVLVKSAPGEASRGRPDTIRRPFPVISGASKCDGDCDDVRMRRPHTNTNTNTGIKTDTPIKCKYHQ